MSALSPKPDQPVQAVADASGRVWPVLFVAAGYNQLSLGPVPSAKSALVGEHGTAAGTAIVRFLPKGPSGNPELEVTLPSGAKVTVLDEATAQLYLAGA